MSSRCMSPDVLTWKGMLMVRQVSRNASVVSFDPMRMAWWRSEGRFFDGKKGIYLFESQKKSSRTDRCKLMLQITLQFKHHHHHHHHHHPRNPDDQHLIVLFLLLMISRRISKTFGLPEYKCSEGKNGAALQVTGWITPRFSSLKVNFQENLKKILKGPSFHSHIFRCYFLSISRPVFHDVFLLLAL